MQRTDHMSLLPHQQNIGTEIMDAVLNAREKYNPDVYSREDVMIALRSKQRNIEHFKALLSTAASQMLEEIAMVSQATTRAFFGQNISLFTPIYISNYCDNHCVYCGFSSKNSIKRHQLDNDGIKKELEQISKTGLKEILILTGEAEKTTSIDYIAAACTKAREKFKVIGVEIYPLNSDGYKKLHEAGVDYVTVFQETYNPDKYERLHLEGNKRIFPYRFAAQERAILGGMRGVGFAALLGVDDWRKDAFSTGLHAFLIQQKYPHAEIAFSCPRLRPIINNAKIAKLGVNEAELLQVIMAYRLLIPSANITISTRERAYFRDNAIKIAANKMSAGVSVGVGEHSNQDIKGDGQFEIDDVRSVDEVIAAIKAVGLEPLMSEYVYV